MPPTSHRPLNRNYFWLELDKRWPGWPSETKIQLSLKIRIIQDQNLYFGYTQLMLWELERPDPYFSDVNYNPEFFYRFHLADRNTRWLDIGPFEHESNGKGGIDERSWDRTYIRYHDERALGKSRFTELSRHLGSKCYAFGLSRRLHSRRRFNLPILCGRAFQC